MSKAGSSLVQGPSFAPDGHDTHEEHTVFTLFTSGIGQEMSAGHGLVPPQNMQTPHVQSPPDLRTKIVEILSNTANGCLTELGYWPGMPQKMDEITQTNLRYEQENLKLWQDNRILNQELERVREELRSAKAEINKSRNEKQALLQQHSGDLHYRQLLSDHQTLQAYYNASCTEIRQLRDYIDHYIARQSLPAQASPNQPQQTPNPSSPTVPAIQNHPIRRKDPNMQSTQPTGPPRQRGPSQSVIIPPPPPDGNQPPPQTHHRRNSSSRNVVTSPHPDQTNISKSGARPPSSTSNPRRISRGSIPMPHAPPPQALLAERPPAPPRTVPSQSKSQPATPVQPSPTTGQPGMKPPVPMAPPLTTPQQNIPNGPPGYPMATHPTSPIMNRPGGASSPLASEAVNPVQRRSAVAPFTTGGPPTTAVSPRSPEFPSKNTNSPPGVPISQEAAKRQRVMSSLTPEDHQNKKPRLEQEPIKMVQTFPDASQQRPQQMPPQMQQHQREPILQASVPPLPYRPNEPPQGVPQTQNQEPIPFAPAEIPQEIPHPPSESRTQELANNAAVNQVDDGEEVELDADGLYPVEECLAQVMNPDTDRPNMQYCALCVARFAKGHLSSEPKPFVDATTEELVLHFTTEHQEVWAQLRQPDPE